MKLLVLGLGKHGKDTFCEILKENFKIKFTSSSDFMNEHLIFDKLKDKYGYKTKKECYDDRHNHRAEWYDIIQSYNKADQTRLASEILKENGIYCGMRCFKQFKESKHLFDLVIWVDAFERLGNTEGKDSMDIPKGVADIVIYNNGTKEEFEDKVKKVGKVLFKSILTTPSYDSAPTFKTVEDRKKDFYNEVAKFKGVYSDLDLSNFYRYWTEHSDVVRNNTKMKFEKQKTFNISLRLRTWSNNSKKFSIINNLNKRGR